MSKVKAKSEDQAAYTVRPCGDREDEDGIIRQALAILERRVVKDQGAFSSPQDVRTFLQVRHASKTDQHQEVFTVLFLNSQNGVIATEDMFTGTLTQTSVYPREVVRAALRHNAAAVILSHNHPSGSAQPSRADEVLTQTLKQTLALVDVRVLDHFIVTTNAVRSMAEMGLV